MVIDPRPLVRVATAGSVDDGKSTFIGRLLFECGSIYEDQFEAIESASRQSGESEVNLALLTDGLKAERSQKITIDVAYRPFATEQRRYLLADAPGHVQYTRNMFTAASTADVAIMMVDAERGPTAQTRRHAFLVSLLRVPHVLVAVNKMDLVGYSESRYAALVSEIRGYVAGLEFSDLRMVPISALRGDNVVERSKRMRWFDGEPVLGYLDGLELGTRKGPVAFRFPVQTSLRPDRTFRGYAGSAVSGTVRVGDEVLIQPRGLTTSVKGLETPDGAVSEASTGEPVVMVFADEVDVGRGDLVVRPGNPATVSQTFEATVCWTGEAPLQTGRSYVLRIGPKEVRGRVDGLVYGIDLETLHRRDEGGLAMNDVGKILVTTVEPVALDEYASNRWTGSVVLVDPDSHEVSGAGVVTRILGGPSPTLFGRGTVVWMTGLSGAGKSTIAEALAKRLLAVGRMAVRLDGDELRAGLCRDLGFSEADRDENIRRTAELAKLLSGQGLTVICSLISPLRRHRSLARETVGDMFREVFVDCSLEGAVARDPKGLYEKALDGRLSEFTGVSAPYEPPESPDLWLQTEEESVEDSVNKLLLLIGVQG